MIYADYTYYVCVYMGNAIKSNDFSRFAVRASAFIDYYTRGKAADNADLDEIKMACCALAEQYQMIDTAQALVQKSLTDGMKSTGGEIESEKVGSYSVTRKSGGESALSAAGMANNAQAALAAVARQYLANTGLLYRGNSKCIHPTL